MVRKKRATIEAQNKAKAGVSFDIPAQFMQELDKIAAEIGPEENDQALKVAIVKFTNDENSHNTQKETLISIISHLKKSYNNDVMVVLLKIYLCKGGVHLHRALEDFIELSFPLNLALHKQNLEDVLPEVLEMYADLLTHKNQLIDVFLVLDFNKLVGRISLQQYKSEFCLGKDSTLLLLNYFVAIIHGFYNERIKGVINIATSNLKKLGETMHVLLTFLNLQKEVFMQEVNEHGNELLSALNKIKTFCIDNLKNKDSHKDMLTQSSLILWTIFFLEHGVSQDNAYIALLHALKGKFDKFYQGEGEEEDKSSQWVEPGILPLALLKGFILVVGPTVITQSKDIILKNNDTTINMDGLEYIIHCCKTISGLSKLFAFQTLETFVVKADSIHKFIAEKTTIIELCIRHLEYQLRSICQVSEGILHTILQYAASESEILGEIIDKCMDVSNTTQKTRFVVLTKILPYIGAKKMLARNKDLINETLGLNRICPAGKYSQNFLEALFSSLYTDSPSTWTSYWMDQIIAFLSSKNDRNRVFVTISVLPIIFNIQKECIGTIIFHILTKISQDEISLLSFLSLLKIARRHKLIKLRANEVVVGSEELVIDANILVQAVHHNNKDICVETLEFVNAESKISEPVQEIEFAIVENFIKQSIKSSYQEYRQVFLKDIQLFFIRIRTSCEKDIKKFLNKGEISESLNVAISFFKRLDAYVKNTVYIEQPVETSLPLLEIIKYLYSLFGHKEYRVKLNLVYPPLNFLEKLGVYDEHFFMYLMNNLKSSWLKIRLVSFDILLLYPDDFYWFSDSKYVEALEKDAYKLCENPKAMISECGALILLLLFKKCKAGASLQFLTQVLHNIESKLVNFQKSLINGSSENLIHGELNFLKLVFGENHLAHPPSSTSRSELEEYKQFVMRLQQLLIKVNETCSVLLSNLGIAGIGESEEEGIDETMESSIIDCRGHPILKRKDGAKNSIDYDNFIVVSVWLAAKENGAAFNNLIRWIEFPAMEHDETKLITVEQIIQLGEAFLNMLFTFKHRGAIEKTAESFSTLCVKLLASSTTRLSDYPDILLDRALNMVTYESVSTVLRRSAGIPPTIIAILRAEPVQTFPKLLARTIKFVVDLAQHAEKDDSKIHALNILRFIFQDASLKHDLEQYVSEAMILATEGFSNANWAIRNSALMAFTAITKRVLGMQAIQKQDISKKGKTLYDFFLRHPDLYNFFLEKLKQENIQDTSSEFVLYPILLFLSRLRPAFHIIEEEKEEEEETKEGAEIKEVEQVKPMFKKPKLKLFIPLIKECVSSKNMLVRQITAAAIVPFIKVEKLTKEAEMFLDREFPLHPSALKNNYHTGILMIIHDLLKNSFKLKDKAHLTDTFYELMHQRKYVLEDKRVSSMIGYEYMKIIRLLYKHDTTNTEAKDKLLIGIYDISSTKILENTFSADLGFSLRKNLILKFYVKYTAKTKDEKNVYSLLKEIMESTVMQTENEAELNTEIIHTVLGVIKKEYKNIKFTKETWLELLMRLLTSDPFRQSIFGKAHEIALSIVYNIIRSMQDEIAINVITMLSGLIEDIIERDEKDPNIISKIIKISSIIVLSALKSKPPNKPLVHPSINSFITLLTTFSHMSQIDTLRIACVKAIINILPVLSAEAFISHEENIWSYMTVIKCIVMLLQDEHPEIRNNLAFYLSEFVNEKKASENMMMVGESVVQYTYNEHVMLEKLLGYVKDEVVGRGDASVTSLYLKYLNDEFIVKNEYREHEGKNYEEKIFFHETQNKYIDLVMLKKQILENIYSVIGSVGVEGIDFCKAEIDINALLGKIREFSNEITQQNLNKFEYIYFTLIRLLEHKALFLISLDEERLQQIEEIRSDKRLNPQFSTLLAKLT